MVRDLHTLAIIPSFHIQEKFPYFSYFDCVYMSLKGNKAFRLQFVEEILACDFFFYKFSLGFVKRISIRFSQGSGQERFCSYPRTGRTSKFGVGHTMETLPEQLVKSLSSLPRRWKQSRHWEKDPMFTLKKGSVVLLNDMLAPRDRLPIKP